jgi:hypothetical protein
MTRKEKKKLALQIKKEIESRKVKREPTQEEVQERINKYNAKRMKQSVNKNRTQWW